MQKLLLSTLLFSALGLAVSACEGKKDDVDPNYPIYNATGNVVSCDDKVLKPGEHRC